MIRRVFLTVVLHGLLFALPGVAEEVGWRGDGTGIFPGAQPPTTWSAKNNILWRTELPGGGYGSPVVCAGKVFAVSQPAEVVCLDAESGEVQWKQTVSYATVLGEAKAAEIEATYQKIESERKVRRDAYEAARKADPNAPELEALKRAVEEVEQEEKEYAEQFPKEKRGGCGNAAATPVCDGRRLYVIMGVGIVAAFDLEGNRLWARHLEVPPGGWGHSSSPLLADGKLIVQIRDLVALDPATGEEIWRLETPSRYGTAVVTTIDGTEVLFTPAGAMVRAADGKLLADKLYSMTNNSPLIHDGKLYAHEGGKTKAYRLPESVAGSVNMELLWDAESTRDARMTSAAYHDGLLYSGGRSGIMDVTDAQTGRVVYRRRLNLGELFSSVAVAGNLVFYGGKDGKTLVLQPGRRYQELAVNELERFSSTPLFVGNRIYLRTDRAMYCIGEAE